MRRRRFDEGLTGAVAITTTLFVLGGLLGLLGHVLRVVDDQLADLSLDIDD